MRPRSIRIVDFGRPSRRKLLGYLMLLPAFLLIAFIILYPLIVSFDISFQNIGVMRIGDARRPWTADNYERLYSSAEFWNSLWVTLKFLVVVTSACLFIGLGTALLLNEQFKGRTLARLIVALPWAIPEVVAVVIFAWIFDSSFGFMNWILIVTGLSNQMINWFSDPTAAFITVSATMIWKGYPFVSIMCLAGLQAIPEDFYNAARVDGANATQRFLHITIPCLMPVLAVTILLVGLWIFRDFSIIYVLTQGGPVQSTQTLSIMTYLQAFSFFKMGYASAIGVITLILCVMASTIMVSRRASALY